MFESGAWELMSVEGSLVTWQRAGEEKRVAQWAVVLRRRAPAHALAARGALLVAAFLLVAAALLPPSTRPPLCAAAAITTTLWSVYWMPLLNYKLRRKVNSACQGFINRLPAYLYMKRHS